VTLLILDVKVPHLADNSATAVMAGITSILPSLLTFAFSFVALCVFWVNHHHFFRQLTHSDWPLLWHNCALLFWLTIVPFTTAFLGAYPTVPLVASVYAFVVCMAAISFNLMIRHALFHSELVNTAIPLAARKRGLQRGWTSIGAYALAAVLAPLSVWIAWALLLFVPVYYFVPQLMMKGEDLDL
jgi:TMEM175 potassium channel family protein